MARSTPTRLRELGPPGRTGDERPDDGPVALPVFVMASLVAFLVILLPAIFFGIRSVEGDIEARAAQRLSFGGVTSLEIDATGRDLSVKGVVYLERQLETVPLALEALTGVDNVTTEIRFFERNEAREITVPSAPFVVTWDGADAAVSGTLQTPEAVAVVAEALALDFPGISTTELVALDGVTDERVWLPTVLELLDDMIKVIPVSSETPATILVNPDALLVSLSAELETLQDRADVRSTAESVLLKLPTFSFTSSLVVKEAPPVTPVEQVEELQQNLDEIVLDKVVEFQTNSDVITTTGQALLDEILLELREFPDVAIEIGGHTDNVGSDEYNLDLSRRRANAVLAYLVAAGENTSRYAVVGYGETRPIADNATSAGQARNRRIEFTALKE